MRNETDVANLALTMIGKSSIVSMDEATATAATCRQHYADARRAQLSRSDWIFARKQIALPRVEAPAIYPGWSVYALPYDFLRMRAVSSPEGIPYHKGRWTGPDFRADSAFVSVEGIGAVASYIFDNEDVASWPPLFAESVAYKLAALVAVKLTGQPKMARDAMELAEAMLLRAIETDASQERATYAKGGYRPNAPMVQSWPIVPGVPGGPVPPGYSDGSDYLDDYFAARDA